MSLVLTAIIPLFIISGLFFMWILGNRDKREKKVYAIAGGKAEQAINSIKTVKQLNGESY